MKGNLHEIRLKTDYPKGDGEVLENEFGQEKCRNCYLRLKSKPIFHKRKKKFTNFQDKIYSINCKDPQNLNIKVLNLIMLLTLKIYPPK
ncbi:MAG: hypothetical protein DRO88_02255 [Promethearchaeia archaeon]|nr:MAG: hypothetical protein DRO88_02255 [Candidatus Lokiarchaeia archaeon]